jgi:hypothetical protein
MAGFFSKLRGTFSSIFQLGKAGSNLKDSAGVIESRNNADTDYVKHRFADPAGDNDGVSRQFYYSEHANPGDPLTYSLENVSLYNASGSPTTANDIQYTRVWLPKGRTITTMRTHITSGANGTRQIQFAIYDQATPASVTGVPNAKVATTAADTPPNATTGQYDVALTSSYLVPTSGFYWLALQSDSNAMNFTISSVFRANSIKRREEASGAFTLPATAGTLTNPQSAVAYVSAVE